MYKTTPTTLFPIDVFPKEIQEIILATHEHLKYPIDFFAAALIYAASIAIGNTHKVFVKEGFVESATVYMAIVGNAGTNKTHPIKFALKPIRERDKASYKVYQEQKQEYDRVMSLSKKDRGQQSTDGSVKPVWPKSIVGDFTLEALIEVHKANLRGIGVHADELASWFKNFNRYSQGSEMEFWLSSWSGSDVSKDRVSGDPALISMPFISVIGTIQPAVLSELARDARSQNGFMDRILFVAPDNLQKQRWSDSELPATIPSQWDRLLANLLERPLHSDEHGSPKPTVLRFNPEARKALFDWQGEITEECIVSNDRTFTSICGKLEVYAARLALILEMLYYTTFEGDKQDVSLKAVQGAIKLTEYFKTNALKVRYHVSEPRPLATLAADKRALYDALPDAFETNEAVLLGDQHKIPERTVKDFLKVKGLFQKASHGHYRKLI